ncbi:MAG TPA: hypothetical protein VFZ65_08255 [Planctomycetota bacterium]|nr:hypothetical protein [Planctomycetota bacterium]
MKNIHRIVGLVLVQLGSALLPAQWGPVLTATAPTARSGALLAFDLLGNRTLMFGGNFTNEFWSLSGDTWTHLTPAVLPGPRARANIATDPITGQILMLGGQDGNGMLALDETWLWNGTVWQQLAPPHSPGGRIWHGMAFDIARQTSVMFGGRNNLFQPNQVLGETWEFSLGDWTQVYPLTSPAPVLEPAMCNHPGLNKVMMFGGQIAGSGGNLGPAIDTTWVFDGVTWTQINTTGVHPPARRGGQMVPILGRNICVLFGGYDPITFDILNDTWEHDGVNWTQVNNVYGGIYPARREFGMTHDFVRDRIVAFGGKTPTNALLDDTWEYGAQFQTFGMGCAGSAGTPLLTRGAPPKLGTTTSANLGNVPPAIPFAFMAVGTSRTQWAFGSLPTLLTPFGMPNCRSYTSADLLVVVPATAGSATWSFNLPLQGSLVGEAYYLQGITFDPGVNALGLAVSNAATLVIGN